MQIQHIKEIRNQEDSIPLTILYDLLGFKGCVDELMLFVIHSKEWVEIVPDDKYNLTRITEKGIKADMLCYRDYVIFQDEELITFRLIAVKAERVIDFLREFNNRRFINDKHSN
ncbi:hypothetical protein [Bartonella sp. DGB1]|uniref:hypothetical protein n=1 Tax=Bartonella sp. DGB1 TaxID=3239807 RepID=UPI003524FB06